MSYELSQAAKTALAEAVTSATARFHPAVTSEILDTPEGSALHIKVIVDKLPNEEIRRGLLAATANAALMALPWLPMPPFVTIMQRQQN